jgi:hypothetical protein
VAGAPLGNQNSAKRNRLLGDTLKRELRQRPEDVLAIVNKTIVSAIAGEEWAQRLIYERVDGKMPQAIVGDDDEPAVKFSRVIRQIVDPQKADESAQPTDG